MTRGFGETGIGLSRIDLGRLADGDGAERERLRRSACNGGAFVLTGHGIEPQAAFDVLALGRRFFALPQEQLDAIDMVHSPYFRGYSVTGSERTQGRADIREQLDVGPEDEPYIMGAGAVGSAACGDGGVAGADEAVVGAGGGAAGADGGAAGSGESPYLRLRGPNLWPAGLPELRPAILGWMAAMRSVSRDVLGYVFDVAGIPGERFVSGFAERPHERLKIIRYPGVAEGGSTQGVGEHRDTGFLSIIVHDGTDGLEVFDGERFSRISAARGDAIVILGSSLQTATGGVLDSALHRVVSPPAGSERVSVAYFFNPRLEFVLDPDAADERAAEYGYEALNVVLRSHPHVAKRYFSDLAGMSTEPSCVS